jgi:hypothetical protein
MKIVEVFDKITALFRELKSALEAIKELLAVLKALKGATGMSKVEKAGWFVAHAGTKTAVSKGIQYGSGGNIKIPGLVGSGLSAGEDYKSAWDDATQAEEAAE